VIDPAGPQLSDSTPSRKGAVSLAIAVVLVAAVLVFFPAYRLFFGISVSIGLIVAAILHFWNKYRPIKEEDVENKRPLGLG
jgi:uncharacterized membrane protein YqjE